MKGTNTLSNYDASRIRKPRKIRTRQKEENLRPKYVIGFDSEADTSSPGRPMLYQFSLPGGTEEETLLYEVPDLRFAGLNRFLDFLDAYCTDRYVEYLIYCWNINYELTQLLHDLPLHIRAESEYTITSSGFKWAIEVANAKRTIVVFKQGRIRVMLLDGMAYYKTSLDKAARMLNLGEKFYSSNVDRTRFTRKDLGQPDFTLYAKRDAYITRRIGEFIQQQHITYGIGTTISAPHFAASVFKTHFLTPGFTLNGLSPRLEQAGLYAYHGGKNGFYLNGPAEFNEVWNYDITSAYPEAMKQLPNIEESYWTNLNTFDPTVHALYLVDLDYTRCKYRGMQNNDGSWPESGIIRGTWITGYELGALLQHNEVRLLSLLGYGLRGSPGGPLSDFVDTFFRIKAGTTGPERETAKLLLNSLYGKFFQKQPIGRVGIYNLDEERWIDTDLESDFDWEAGGLYNPPVASLITGYVRAKIHKLEHKYDSLMTSTDGFFGTLAPDADDLGKHLGGLNATAGRLRIWRERLYIFDPPEERRKYALHGFRGTVEQLENEIPLSRGEYIYIGKTMVTLKQSTVRIRGMTYEPGQFLMAPYTLVI